MGIESWMGFGLALLVALAVPGPDLVLVVQSATRGVREGAATASGVVTALTLHALLAAAGVSALIVSLPGALSTVQILGAGVLLWMGVSMLRSAGSSAGASAQADSAASEMVASENPTTELVTAAPVTAAPVTAARATTETVAIEPATATTATSLRKKRGDYARGFLTNATNPKALLFFAAILPQFVGHGDGMEERTVTMCALVVLGGSLWWAGTILVVRLVGFHRSRTADRIVTLLGGIALLIVGGALAIGTLIGLAT